ncbi:MAG: intein-containing DNA gyrase subunit B [Anaerolineae bacterium]|nr:intein-containing DNA gyrase subunit B [Anaerolineae bacterium]
MYVGGTDIKALHHLVYEVVDNAIDEAMAGRCDYIEVVIHADNTITVHDNGGGIPVGINHQLGISTLTAVFTRLHFGGKFGSGAYSASGGLHGIGVKAVNALSDYTIVKVRREGYLWQQTFSRGEATSEVEQLRELEPGEVPGTSVSFMPDATIMQETVFDYDTLEDRFRQMAYLVKGVTIRLVDERIQPLPKETTFYFEGGLRSFVRYLNRNRDELHGVISGNGDLKFKYSVEGKSMDGVMLVDFALQYADTTNTLEMAFANTIHTREGGSHLTGMRTALTRVLNNYARKAGYLKDKDSNFTGSQTLEGLTAIVAVRHPNPQFENQTKNKLMNTEVAGAVSGVVGDAFTEYLENNPKEAKLIIEKCLTTQRIQDALAKQRELLLNDRKTFLSNTTLPGKLADCSERGLHTELFIVEGDSAGGCFSGDTRVALADGRSLSFLEIIEEQAQGKQHFCYTIRNDGTIGLQQIVNPRRTKQNADVVRVTLDNGENIICTPDHRFMLRDGSYKAAADLTSADSLMPLHRKLSDTREKGITINGYEMAWDPRSDSWLFTHILADWHNRWQGVYTQDAGDHCHHLDFNKRNNNPTNIQRMPASAHLELHRQHVERTLHRPDVITKWRKARQTDEFRTRMSQRMQQPDTRQLLSEQAKAQWADDEYKAYMGAQWRKFYEENPEYREQNRQQLTEAQEQYWSIEENRQAQAKRVRTYFEQNPEARRTASERSIEQWNNPELRDWRRGKTSEQWTEEFRAKRHTTLSHTYYNKTIAALKQIEFEHGQLDLAAYRQYRIAKRDKSLLRFDTFCERYFAGDEQQAREAVANYNHRVVSVEHLSERIDVYDIEVPGTHNFALESGVFVHNSAKQARDRHFQAILPVFGKMLNTERVNINKILESEKIRMVIMALGTGIREDFNVEKLRYGRIILMSDADVDGSHIRTLMLTFFYRYMQPIVSEGRLFIAQPPIYRMEYKKQVTYVYPEARMRDEQLMTKWLKNYSEPEKVGVQRYKGLGEMNPEQLWETTMNPEKRLLLQVTLEDAAQADQTFDMLMGPEVPPRRNFIIAHSKDATLDI